MDYCYKLDLGDKFTPQTTCQTIFMGPGQDFSFDFWQQVRISKRRNKKAPAVHFPAFFNERSLDLLYLSFAVSSADALSLRKDAADGWSRELKISLPVLDLDFWEAHRALVEDMVSFLSGDKWHFEFRRRSLTAEETEQRDLHQRLADKKFRLGREIRQYSQICMLSGGLDSFVGAIDLLSDLKNGERVMFVGHHGSGKGVYAAQKDLGDALEGHFADRFDGRDLRFFHSRQRKLGWGTENSTRPRSLVFFAHAIALASAQGAPVTLTIPENGLISLNVPLTPSRTGSSSTRTTHPFYMSCLQQLLKAMGLPITINLPYRFKTKGEMLCECRDQDFLKEHVAQTMSCAHPEKRNKTKGEPDRQHCGYCLPCIIRRAALRKAGFPDKTDKYRVPNCPEKGAPKREFNSYRYALQHYDHSLSDTDFALAIQCSGQVAEEVRKFAAVYRRGMAEIADLIESIPASSAVKRTS